MINSAIHLVTNIINLARHQPHLAALTASRRPKTRASTGNTHRQTRPSFCCVARFDYSPGTHKAASLSLRRQVHRHISKCADTFDCPLFKDFSGRCVCLCQALSSVHPLQNSRHRSLRKITIYNQSSIVAINHGVGWIDFTPTIVDCRVEPRHGLVLPLGRTHPNKGHFSESPTVATSTTTRLRDGYCTRGRPETVSTSRRRVHGGQRSRHPRPTKTPGLSRHSLLNPHEPRAFPPRSHHIFCCFNELKSTFLEYRELATFLRSGYVLR